MNVSYRQATFADAAALAKVETISLQTAYREFLPAPYLDRLSVPDLTKAWQGELESVNRYRVIVAVTDEIVIGFVRGGTEKEYEGDVGGITHIFILPEYWGAGVGKVLMAMALDAMRDFGMASAKLWAYRQNTRAVHFYERLGWTLDGRTCDNDIDGAKFEMLCYQRPIKSCVSTILGDGLRELPPEP